MLKAGLFLLHSELFSYSHAVLKNQIDRILKALNDEA